MDNSERPADAPADEKRSRTPRRRKRQRGVIEQPKGSGIWYAQYFCKGCSRHTATAPRMQRRHREMVGSQSLAEDVVAKRRTEIREHRFFPDAAKPWDPVFSDYATDYLARTGSNRRDGVGAERYARYWRLAPETKKKTMRTLTRQDFERYRERRRASGAIGAKRGRGGASVSTVNKELSFARAVFNDFIDALEDRGLPPIPNPVRTALFDPEPAHLTRYLTDHEETRLAAVFPSEHWPAVVVAMHTGLDRGAVRVATPRRIR